MKLALRDLKQEKWTLDVEESDTVAQVKEKNAAERGYASGVQQKMIYSGKILKDNDTISSYKINPDKDFIVCMITKAKAKPAAPVAAASTAASTGATAATAGAAGSATESRSTESSSTDASSAGDSSFATGSHLEAAINNIVDMGYSRPLVVIALRLAYNNPDRAVEYLVNGDAERELEAQRERQAAGAAAGAAGAADAEPASGAAAATVPVEDETAPQERDTTDINLFDEGARAPEYGADETGLGASAEELLQLREAIRRNPGLMEPLIQQLSAQNPHLAEAIAESIGDFMREDGEELGDDEMMQDGDEVPQHRIEITPEEDAAITRLTELGFERGLVIQAYFACDKNEELTANYLLEHGYDDE